eukprot:2579929-Heterocapsa_arctica.AAC.1
MAVTFESGFGDARAFEEDAVGASSLGSHGNKPPPGDTCVHGVGGHSRHLNKCLRIYQQWQMLLK